MSVEHYDLGQRLRAAVTGRPVPRSCHALALAPVDPVAVAVHHAAGRVTLTATDATTTRTGTGRDALAALHAVHGDPTDTHRTLVVADRATLRALTALARSTPPGGPHEQLAEVLDWWQDRAEHPGSGAVLVLTEACQARWTLGVTPTEEHRFTTWRTWLGLTATDPHAPGTSGLLPAAAQVTAGTPLPGLDTAAHQDRDSWMALRSRTVTPAHTRTWRSRDTRARAALGLASRSDAAELMASRTLDDPLVAAREAHTGNVVHAVLTATPEPGVLEAHADRLTCRLRPGADLTVTAHLQRALPVPTVPTGPQQATPADPRVSAVLSSATVTGDGRLALVMAAAARSVAALTPGDRLTVRAAAVSPAAQANARRTLGSRYRHRGNWLAAGTAPAPARRGVPLDVAVAAADT